MPFSTTAMALTAGLTFLGGLTDAFDDIDRASCADVSAEVGYDIGLATSEVSGITSSWVDTGADMPDSYRFAQAVSYNESDPGNVRTNGPYIRFQESNNGSHGAEDVDLLSVCDLGETGLVGEAGSFSLSVGERTDLSVISFANTYTNPVLFVQVTTSNDSSPVIALPVAVYDTGAAVALVEPANYNGPHGGEWVHWMVLEAGRYEVDGDRGIYAEVGTVDVSDTTYTTAEMEEVVPAVEHAYGNSFSTGPSKCFENAAVFAAPQAAVAADYHGTRVIKDEDGDVLTGFRVRHMRRRAIEYNDSATTEGAIGYLVIGEKSSDTSCADDNEWAFGRGMQNWLSDDVGDATYDPETTPTSETNPFCDGSEIVESLWSQDDAWGDSVAGADYSLKVGLQDKRATGGELWIGGSADGNVTLLGTSLTVFDVGVEATTDADDNNASRAWLEAVGGIIDWEVSGAAELGWSQSKTLLSASSNFYGVTVSASAIGRLGITGSVALGAAGISADAMPYASLVGEASASLGIWCASVSVSATLTLVYVGVDVDIGVTVQGGTTYWSVDSDLVLESLAGSIDLYINWCLDNESYNLFKFRGVSDTYHLLDDGGCI